MTLAHDAYRQHETHRNSRSDVVWRPYVVVVGRIVVWFCEDSKWMRLGKLDNGPMVGSRTR